MTVPHASHHHLPAQALRTIERQISEAVAKAPKPAAHPTLIAVSKTFGPERILPFLEAGHIHFGENRVQEAKGKWPSLKASFPDTMLHLIGPLQTNKVKDAVALFDVIHTLDRIKLAQSLRAEIDKTGKPIELFVQVNTGEEPQKAGLTPDALDPFLGEVHSELHLPVSGLMCIPPQNDPPALHFALLAKLAKRNGLTNLSMGMSGDFETAIAYGATHIRVGSALFGARESPDSLT